MADFNVPESPVFEEKIRQLETTDPAHASVFNNILVKLFHNNVFNRKKQQEHEVNKQNPHKITPTQIGAATVDALDMAYQNGNAYTDSKIADLINGAPNTMDTLKEISDAMAANKTVVDALEDSIGSKAPKAELDTHVTNKTLHITAAERTKWNTVDTALSGTSTNPIQNKVVKAAFDQQNVKNSSLEGSIEEVNSNLGWYIENGILPPINTYHNLITAGAGVASASNYSKNLPPNFAFDGNESSAWFTEWNAGGSPVESAYLYFTFARQVNVKTIKFLPNSQASTKTVNISHSIDGINYFDIGTYPYESEAWKIIELPTLKKMVHLRLFVQATSLTQAGMKEVQVLGF